MSWNFSATRGREPLIMTDLYGPVGIYRIIKYPKCHG